MDLEKISNLIKTKRKEKNLTQEELATRLNVTEKAISRWETGRGTPDISLLIPLSKELEIDVSELLSGSEKKKTIKNEIEKVIEYEEYNKKSKNKFSLIISIIIYVLLLLFYLAYLKVTYDNSSFEPSEILHGIINIFFIILIIVSNWNLYTYYFDKLEDKEKVNKITYALILAIYIIMILNMTIFGRTMHMFAYFKESEYSGLNLIPFTTIYDVFFHYQKYNNMYVLINLLGNLVIFMPIQYILIKLIDNLSLKKNIMIAILIPLFIEFLQLITGSGVFDIDDIILNFLGMITVYYIVRNYQKKKDKKIL